MPIIYRDVTLAEIKEKEEQEDTRPHKRSIKITGRFLKRDNKDNKQE